MHVRGPDARHGQLQAARRQQVVVIEDGDEGPGGFAQASVPRRRRALEENA
jgi:hypothetical protein